MSNAINVYFENAQLSLAAYATLNHGMTDKDYVEALKAADMPESEATEFVKSYEIVDQEPEDETGFSATLFRCWHDSNVWSARRS